MSHSRNKGHRPNQERQQRSSTDWNPSGAPSNMRNTGNYGDPEYGESERYGGQSAYGGSQGSYGSQGGYRAINYADRFGNPSEESGFQGSPEYRQDPRYGQQGWRSPASPWENENRWQSMDRTPQYREGQSDRGYRPWDNDTYTGNMYRGRRSEGGMESDRDRQQGRQQNNVKQFGQRGMQPRGTERWSNESSQQSQQSPQRQSFAGRGPQGYKRSDERITEDINEALTEDPELDAAEITVEVKEAEVLLKGTVPDRESKRRAEEIAECCSGVKEVMNQLRIKREDSGDSEDASRREKSDDKRGKAAS